ncbi:MAG TPA: DUF305 domain-containing protein [Ilumatobacter sp.]|nr:DUF305 domain-containing protein [Ilumatobacter sp.]
MTFTSDSSDTSLPEAPGSDNAVVAVDDIDGDGDGDGDGDIVLPWWQHPLNILTLVVTAALLAGMVGWMIGDSNSELAHSEVDTGFLQDMREHHEQGVYMSFVYRALPDIDPGLSTVAASIVIGQNQEIGRMVQMLRMFGEPEANEGDTAMAWMGMPVDRGQMPGMASESDLDQLATLSGREADEFFVQLMTAHHEGGIHMAEYASGNAENDEVQAMAASIMTSQADEIAEMQRELDQP